MNSVQSSVTRHTTPPEINSSSSNETQLPNFRLFSKGNSVLWNDIRESCGTENFAKLLWQVNCGSRLQLNNKFTQCFTLQVESYLKAIAQGSPHKEKLLKFLNAHLPEHALFTDSELKYILSATAIYGSYSIDRLAYIAQDLNNIIANYLKPPFSDRVDILEQLRINNRSQQIIPVLNNQTANPAEKIILQFMINCFKFALTEHSNEIKTYQKFSQDMLAKLENVPDTTQISADILQATGYAVQHEILLQALFVEPTVETAVGLLLTRLNYLGGAIFECALIKSLTTELLNCDSERYHQFLSVFLKDAYLAFSGVKNSAYLRNSENLPALDEHVLDLLNHSYIENLQDPHGRKLIDENYAAHCAKFVRLMLAIICIDSANPALAIKLGQKLIQSDILELNEIYQTRAATVVDEEFDDTSSTISNSSTASTVATRVPLSKPPLVINTDHAKCLQLLAGYNFSRALKLAHQIKTIENEVYISLYVSTVEVRRMKFKLEHHNRLDKFYNESYEFLRAAIDTFINNPQHGTQFTSKQWLDFLRQFRRSYHPVRY